MAPNTLTNIGLIFQREYRERVRKRTFVISTIIIALVAFLGPFVPTILRAVTQGDAQTRLVVLDQAGPVAGQDATTLVTNLDQTLNAGSAGATTGSTSGKPAFVVTKAPTTNATALVQQVKDHTLDSLLVITRRADGELVFAYTTKRDPDSSSVAQVRQTVNALAASDRLERAGLNAAQQRHAFSPAVFQVSSTSNSTFNNGKSDAENLANYFITTAMVALMYAMIVLYGQWIAGGVVEEKSSRVMEIMINAATATQLMAGKILGVGAAALTQMSVLVVSAIAGFLAQGPLGDALLGPSSGGSALNITGSSVSLLLMSLLFFLLGFALFSTLYAGLGSLVSRPEEVNQAVSPVQFLLLPGYLIGIAALPAINEPWVKILSFIPVLTPTLMIARIGVGQVSPGEVLLSIALMLVCIFVMLRVAARLYRNGVLYYGQKLSVLRALRTPNPGGVVPQLESGKA